MSILAIVGGALGVSTLGLGALAIFAPGLLAKWAKAAVDVLREIPPKGWLAIGAAALLALNIAYIMHLRNDVTKAKAETVAAHKETENERAAHVITKHSLDGALAQIDDNNKRIEAANQALQAARQEAAAADARANARYEPTGASVRRLEASAATKGLPPCTVSQEAAHALDGL